MIKILSEKNGDAAKGNNVLGDCGLVARVGVRYLHSSGSQVSVPRGEEAGLPLSMYQRQRHGIFFLFFFSLLFSSFLPSFLFKKNTWIQEVDVFFCLSYGLEID